MAFKKTVPIKSDDMKSTNENFLAKLTNWPVYFGEKVLRASLLLL